uniref:50S ribosomal protein L34 n=1 Tax=Muribaculaceae bacterium Z82 TaxID=2304548 RepID=A0A7C9NBN5_9BACT
MPNGRKQPASASFRRTASSPGHRRSRSARRRQGRSRTPAA